MGPSLFSFFALFPPSKNHFFCQRCVVKKKRWDGERERERERRVDKQRKKQPQESFLKASTGVEEEEEKKGGRDVRQEKEKRERGSGELTMLLTIGSSGKCFAAMFTFETLCSLFVEIKKGGGLYISKQRTGGVACTRCG